MLNSGTKLGPYEIVAPLGTGGMGEVYRARDTKLGREVALKVLPEAFASDAERMARFEREAKVLASLNHPNIAAIYGFEDSGGVHALVMELVEGPTLAERISGSVAPGFSPAGAGLKASATQGSADLKVGATQGGRRAAVPLDEALPLARQICEGLEYAHERGIVHRDLKPANVKITAEGTVKILDFGLAKALEGESAAGDVSTSPTLSRLGTQAGIILGTAAYMSPEQAKGKPVDRRADIWAFGCVLYEMLTGKQTFSGETVTDVLAAVVMKEPDWAALPAETPRAVRNLLERCLDKDARQRLQAIGEARIALEQAMTGATREPTGLASDDAAMRSWRRAMPWIVSAACLILAAAFAAGYLARAPRPMPAHVSEISPPTGTSFVLGGDAAGPPVISPDGERLAFTAMRSDGKYLLWVRPLDAATAYPLQGTEGATFPFWSADSRSLGFFANGKLNRIDASGGPPLAIADVSPARGGSWSADGTILLTPDTASPIYRLPASGGTPQPVTKLNAARQEISHRWPQFLPDGKHFLFYAHGNDPQNNATYAASLDGGEPRLLIRGDSNAVYAPPGYLLFVREGTLTAQRFDPASLRLTGDAVPLAEHVGINAIVWRGIFTSSGNGILAYGAGNAALYRIAWYDRSGKQTAAIGEPGDYHDPRISPDGRKLAYTAIAPVTSDWAIQVYDLARGVSSRLTFSSSINREPAWSPDGKTIAFQSNRSGQFHIYQRAADGTGRTAPLLVDQAAESFPSFSSDGRYLTFDRQAPAGHKGIRAMPLFGDRKPFPVVQNQQYDASEPSLSTDGKWLAYTSRETGRLEVYIVPFGHGSGKWLVSTGGGRWPRWRRDGKELFYMSPDNKVVSAEISESGSSLVIGRVAPLFQVRASATTLGWSYDVSGDGKRFVIVTETGEQVAAPVTLVVNWPALLRKQ